MAYRDAYRVCLKTNRVWIEQPREQNQSDGKGFHPIIKDTSQYWEPGFIRVCYISFWAAEKAMIAFTQSGCMTVQSCWVGANQELGRKLRGKASKGKQTDSLWILPLLWSELCTDLFVKKSKLIGLPLTFKRFFCPINILKYSSSCHYWYGKVMKIKVIAI